MKNREKSRGARYFVAFALATLFLFGTNSSYSAEEGIKIGLNYPETGPYSKQGLDQRRGAEMAMDEINASGGILGKKVSLLMNGAIGA